MKATLLGFLEVARNAGISVSNAESIDAFNALALVGYDDRLTVKDSLGLVLAKTAEERRRFDACFDRYFDVGKLDAAQRASDSEALEPAESRPESEDGTLPSLERILLDDARADLAVLKIEAKGERLPTIAIDAEENPQVGDLVLAIGDPFGVGQTVTNGIVSALARSGVGGNDYAFFIQTDASINPGNSGGPLVDMNGDMIGVNTAIVSSSGASAGIGFAIPAVMARQVVDAALNGDHAVARPWLGVRTQALTEEMARSFGLEAPEGVVVTDVWPGGSAARAGVARGDVIVSVAGEGVNDDGGLTYLVGTRHLGETLPLVIRRSGQKRTLNLTVEAPPATPAPDKRTIAGHNPLAGASVVNVSPAAAQQYGVDPFAAQGVLVTQIDGGYAQNIGVRPGDFIREVNGQKIATTADLEAAVQTGAHAWTLSIQRGDQVITARFSG